MKVRGAKVEGGNKVIIAIPRSQGADIVFEAKAIEGYEAFEKLCPIPQPRMLVKPGGVKVPDVTNPIYRSEIESHSRRRMSWMIIESLRATPGLEWDTVDYDKPETWDNYEKDMKSAGFSFAEIMRIVQGVMEANSLSEERIVEARQRFLAGQQEAPPTSSSPQEEQATT